MKSYKALIALDLKLALRNRSVIFFNYLFPLVFFFIIGGSRAYFLKSGSRGHVRVLLYQHPSQT